MYRIGEFSKLTRTTIKTLRYYDEVGLLKPGAVDEWTGYRYYTTSQFYPLGRILALRQAGLSVSEIQSVLSGQDARTILTARKAALERDRVDVDERLQRLTSLLNHLEEDQTMAHQATVKQIPSYTAYVREGVVGTYADITPFIQSANIEAFTANPDLALTDPPYTYISYLDGEYRETDVHVRFVQAVQKAGRDTPNVRFMPTEAVEAISVYHRGAYDTLGDAYTYALSWAEANGYQVAGLARERYIDGIWNKTNMDDWLTELQLPVQKG